ncbi:MAG TPA: hypothetical protein VNL35_02820 [Chloroflexota bacterium]|nr:hypothetical protein [Chloroflexota bacterium]
MSPKQRAYYQDVPMVPYDLIKEGLIALLVVLVLVCGLAALLSSPDEPPLTAQQVATSDPVTFLQTALGELNGTDSISTYGPPYNNGSGSVQSLGPISFQRLAGVRIPINTASDDVLGPLRMVAPLVPSVGSALQSFERAGPTQQTTWETAYGDALNKARVRGQSVLLPPGAYGPVAPMLTGLLNLGRAGLLEPAIDHSGRIYSTDNTRGLLFLQASALPVLAHQYHLVGTQWGMMNETGNYPGAAWLWLYTFWYQVPAFASSPNADVLVIATMGILTLLLLLLPWIPGLNQLPRLLGVYRLIWRAYYREQAAASPVSSGSAVDPPAGLQA